MSLLLHPSLALCGLSLTLFRRTIRYSCFSVLDGLDFHLRIHHFQKEASICPPSWLLCIIACLPVFIADAKSSSFPPVPVIFLSLFLFFFFFFVVLLLSAQSGHSERGLFVLQPGTQLFSGSTLFFSSPSVQ